MSGRAVVTGGAGFIGSHLVEALAAEGWTVTVVDDLSRGDAGRLPAGVELVTAAAGSPAVDAVLARAPVDVLFHLAAQVDAGWSVAHPVEDARINVLESLELLERCRHHAVGRVVFASSAAVYGEPAAVPLDEEAPKRPQSPYGIAKLAVEGYLAFYREVHRLPSVALRFANVYGPRQDATGEAGVVAVFASRLIAGGSATIHGDGRQTRDFVYVGDVVAAALAAARSTAVGEMNVGTAVESDVVEVFDRLAAALAPGARPAFGPARSGEPRRSALSPRRAAAALGWQARVGLAEGLDRTADWFRHNLQGSPR